MPANRNLLHRSGSEMGNTEEKKKTIALTSRISSDNSEEVMQKILDEIGEDKDVVPVLDAQDLEYISSAGLRMILRLKKQYPKISVINTSSSVYEIFEMTGFTQMFTVEKAYRSISVEGCEEIGWGANSRIYRIDEDNVVKVYKKEGALDEIRCEREQAKRALILGIPTAISYEVVKVGDYYGSVFELLEPTSFSNILVDHPEKIDWCVDESIKLLKKIHAMTAPEGMLPDMRDTARGWINDAAGYLPEEANIKLNALLDEIPFSDHLIHGDYHTKNILLQKDEVLLIDMETLSTGHPIFELAAMFYSYIGFSELDHENVVAFQGYDFETSTTFWHKSLAAYLETDDADRLREVEEKAAIIGYARMIRFVSRHGQKQSKEEIDCIDFWSRKLLEYLKHTDTLLY